MTTTFRMSEESMQRMEAHIPELAGAAVKRAYWQALTTTGKVLEARNGQLVETTAEGFQQLQKHQQAFTNIDINRRKEYNFSMQSMMNQTSVLARHGWSKDVLVKLLDESVFSPECRRQCFARQGRNL